MVASAEVWLTPSCSLDILWYQFRSPCVQQDVCDLRVSKCRGVAYTYLLNGHPIEVIGNCGGTQVVQNAIYIPQLQDQEESGLRSRREVEQIIKSPRVQRDMSDRSVSKCRDREMIDEDFEEAVEQSMWNQLQCEHYVDCQSS